ncbi:MAG TPA: hypothetical protein VJP40_09535 [bacterium]|nr:hypothetical protein [bacterium]
MSTLAKLSRMLLLLLLSLGSACGGGSDDWREQPYEVPAGKSLDVVLQEVSNLSGISFSVDPELQAKLDAEPVQLPVLLGFNVAQVLTLIQDNMPHESSFLYEELSSQSILLIPDFQQSENLAAAAPRTILDFDQVGQLGFRLMISDPQFEEEVCGGEDLGIGGIFEFVAEVQSDPDGHSEFIGEFPPTVEYSIEGNQISIFGDAPWVMVSGELQEDGAFSAAGSGTVAGFPDVTVEFLGQAQPGQLTGTLTMGAGGELPGGNPAIYSIHP